MAEFPAMPLWTDAYLGDTTHLTTVEHGAYFLLLIVAWRSKEGTLPDDDTMLARYSKLSATQWKKIRPILEPFFRIENGVWTQGRLSDERAAVKNNSSRQSDKAKARWLKTNKTSDAVAMPDSCRDDASLTLTLPLPQKDVVVVSAREDEPPELPQQVTLSKRIGQITGWDTNPNWFGDYSRLEAWLHSGWDAELDILPTITRIVAQRKAKNQDIPKNLNYFEQAVANAHATRLAPTPKGTPNENTGTSYNGRAGKHAGHAPSGPSVDEQAEALKRRYGVPGGVAAGQPGEDRAGDRHPASVLENVETLRIEGR